MMAWVPAVVEAAKDRAGMNTRELLALSLILVLTLVPITGTYPVKAADSPGIVVDVGLFHTMDTPCLIVRNQGMDVIAEYVDSDGKVVARMASWMGREGRFLLPPPTQSAQSIHLRSLRGHRVEAGDYVLESCPRTLPDELIEALGRAQDLRMMRFLGSSVDSDLIEESLGQALESISAAPLPEWQAIVHFELGTFYTGIGSLGSADSHFQSAKVLFTDEQDLIGQAATLNELGLVAWRRGDLALAWDLFQDALAIRAARQDIFAMAVLANNLALLLNQRGELEQAQQYYEMALNVLQGPVDLRQAIAPEQASPIAEQFAELADLPAALNLLNNLALLQRDLGQPHLAERYWRNYLALEQYLAHAMAPAQARSNLGRMLLRQGRLDESLLLLITALEQFESQSAMRWVGEASTGLSQLYLLIGDFASAIHYGQRAVEAAQDDVEVKADALRALGWLHVQVQDYTQSASVLEQAVELFQQANSHISWLMSQSELAHVWFFQGHADEALLALEEIHLELESRSNPDYAALVLARIGEIHLVEGRHDQARSALEQALAGHRAADNVLAEIHTLALLGQLYSARSNDQAMEFNQQALALLEGMNLQHLPPLRQAEFLATQRRLFDAQVEALLEAGKIQAAWQVAESARARGFRELRQARARSHVSGQRKALLDARGQLIHEASNLRQSVEQESASRRPVANQQLDLARSLDELEARLRQLETDAIELPPIPEPGQVQELLNEDQVMISYHLGRDRSHGWLISRHGFQVEQLPASKELENSINDLLTQLRHPRHARGRIHRRLDELRHQLIAPFETALAEVNQVFIQADGVLHSLPFGLLVSGSDRVIPVTQILTVRSDHSQRPSSNPGGELLVMADPGWRTDATAQSVFPEHSLLGRLVRDQALFGLPGTRQEARAIAALVSSQEHVQLRLGASATREFVLNGGLENHRLVHIATHGLVDLDYPMLSSLLLSGEETAGPAFLRPHDIAELNLQAELVTLSGCETGHGRILAGEGALSLARPFLVAGAQQVLASLWKIDDHRTTVFMTRFYDHLLADGHSPDLALALTQNWMRQQPESQHPYYWAGFVLTSSALFPNS
jgi:CHAT domain-containing protein